MDAPAPSVDAVCLRLSVRTTYRAAGGGLIVI
jgi:hypothetical protein